MSSRTNRKVVKVQPKNLNNIENLSTLREANPIKECLEVSINLAIDQPSIQPVDQKLAVLNSKSDENDQSRGAFEKLYSKNSRESAFKVVPQKVVISFNLVFYKIVVSKLY